MSETLPSGTDGQFAQSTRRFPPPDRSITHQVRAADAPRAFHPRCRSMTAARARRTRIRPARAAGQRGNETAHCRIGMAIKSAQINATRRTARRASHPQKPIPRCDGGADRRREQHRHALGLALVPGDDQALGIFKDLSVGCATGSCLFLGRLPALIIHLAAVEAHDRIVVECERESICWQIGL
jgi:hypothetical protein